MLRRPPNTSSQTKRLSLRACAGIVSVVVALTAASLTGEAKATIASASNTKKTTTTKRRVVRAATTKRRALPVTTKAITSSLPPTTVALPTVVTVPSTLPTPVTTTTTAAPSTTAALAFDFDVLVPTPSQSAPAGTTASYVVIVSPKPGSIPRAVTFIATGMPEGSNATLSPNPTSSAAEFRVNVGQNVPTGNYTIRLIGSANNVLRTVNVFLTVTAATNPTTSTTTTVAPGPTTSTIVAGVGSSTFAVVVSSNGTKLRTGGSVPFFVRIIYAAGFNTPAALQVNGLPPGVSGGFTPMTTEGTSTLFVSSSVAIIPGTYQFNLIVIAGSYQQLVPLTLVIE